MHYTHFVQQIGGIFTQVDGGEFSKGKVGTILLKDVNYNLGGGEQSEDAKSPAALSLNYPSQCPGGVAKHLTFWRRTFFQILAHPVFKM
jgi:hypothetical protein